MATVKIAFDGGNVPVITGAKPAAQDVPIADPIPAGGNTNASFLALAGVHFYGLSTSIPHSPLWLRGNAIDGVPLDLSFKKMEMG
jgi:hypothetical protein